MKYTLANLSKDEVSAAVIVIWRPVGRISARISVAVRECSSQQSGTNEDASLDAILMLAQKVDGEIQITQMETGRVDDDAGYGVYQTQDGRTDHRLRHC